MQSGRKPPLSNKLVFLGCGRPRCRAMRQQRASPRRSPVRHLAGKIQSQGNVCQGNEKEPVQDHSPDNHSPDFSPAFSIRHLRFGCGWPRCDFCAFLRLLFPNLYQFSGHSTACNRSLTVAFCAFWPKISASAFIRTTYNKKQGLCSQGQSNPVKPSQSKKRSSYAVLEKANRQETIESLLKW